MEVDEKPAVDATPGRVTPPANYELNDGPIVDPDFEQD